MENSNIMRMPFTSVQHLNTPNLQQMPSERQKTQISSKDHSRNDNNNNNNNNNNNMEDIKIIKQQEDQLDNLSKDQMITLIGQYKRVLNTCFDENDRLRIRVSKLESLYSAAQDELESKDRAIEELANFIDQLQSKDETSQQK